MVRPSDRALALLVLVGAAVVLGLAPILVRLTETGPAAAGFWRFAFAVPLLALLAGRPGGDGPGLPSRWALLAALFFVTDLGFWHYSIVMTSVANATVLCNLTPVVVTLFAWLVLKQPPRPLFVLAIALAVGGAWAMAAGKSGEQGSNPLLGDAFALSVSLWYAGYFLIIQHARKREGAARLMLWSTASGAPLLLLLAVILGEDLRPDGWGWAACAGLGAMHVLGQGGVAWALGRLPATLTAVVVLIQPVVATVIAWAAFGETITAVQGLGGALVLTAVVLAQRTARNTTGAEAEAAAPARS